MKLSCLFGKHHYYTIRKFSKTISQIGCKNCPGCWGIHHEVKTLLKWDKELNDFHYET